jgi:succinate dehydrogenase/fumarate reductase flavoprotein subunit
MAYSYELKQLIKRVEETRPDRMAKRKEGWEFPRMSLVEKENRLRSFHPSYQEGSLKELQVGPSKGYSVAPEICEILESWSRIDPDQVDLSKTTYETDILIIGGGGAGTAAALLAQGRGAKVILATKLRHGDANTMMAEGGIQVASQPGKDSPYYHYLDTLGGGHFANIPQLVHTLVTQAPSVLQWLEKLGAMFDKNLDGSFKVFHLGGTCRKRVHVAADITGAEIMRTIRDEARNRTGIEVLEFLPVVELVFNEHGHCAGALLYNLETEEYLLVKAKAVILATGGSGRLHIGGFMTTNHYGATGDGLVLGYRAGVEVCLLHTTQFHPTGAIFPEQAEGLLISEKFRGAEAQLLNIDGNQFVFEREPRDACAASIIRECVQVGKGVPTPTDKVGIWLDTPMIDLLHGKGCLVKSFVGKYKIFKRYGIDITKEPILVYPTLHYQNGGIKFKETGETSIPGLFSAGEVTGGVHGENRLGGNSLLDVLVFGRIAGENAALYAKGRAKEGRLTLDHVRKFHQELEEAGIDRKRISPILLPDYSNPLVKQRQLTTQYQGTIR